MHSNGALVRCPGCGAEFPASDGPTHPYMLSSPGCWDAYCQVLAREYSSTRLLSVHRLSVDTYAVQHPGTGSRQAIQSVCLHLVRLYMQLELKLAPEKANAGMLALSKRKSELLWLTPPATRGSVTVADVLPHVDGEAHGAAVTTWARAALSAWSAYYEIIASWASAVPVDGKGRPRRERPTG